MIRWAGQILEVTLYKDPTAIRPAVFGLRGCNCDWMATSSESARGRCQGRREGRRRNQHTRTEVQQAHHHMTKCRLKPFPSGEEPIFGHSMCRIGCVAAQMPSVLRQASHQSNITKTMPFVMTDGGFAKRPQTPMSGAHEPLV